MSPKPKRTCLHRVLQSLWELLLRMILDAVAENRGVQVEFYNRFQYTVEVSDCRTRFPTEKRSHQRPPHCFLPSSTQPCVLAVVQTLPYI